MNHERRRKIANKVAGLVYVTEICETVAELRTGLHGGDTGYTGVAWKTMRTPPYATPMDYEVAKGWWRAGVPLAIVLDTMHDVAERREKEPQWNRDFPLRYCKPAVEEAYDNYLNLSGKAQAPIESGPVTW